MRGMASTREYALAKGATTLLDNSLTRLWTIRGRSRENCIQVAACLLHANVKITELLNSVGCKPTDEEIKKIYDGVARSFNSLDEDRLFPKP